MSRRLAPAVAILISLLSAFAGCMSDPVTGPEVRPRLVLPPARVAFYSPPSSFVAPDRGDLVVHWTRSAADTQLNFKGYYVKLWRTSTGLDPNTHDQKTTWIAPVDSMHVKRVLGQVDTSVTFHNIQLGEYTAVVWGEKATDTIGYSADSVISNTNHIFDPRPLQNPTEIEATSIAPNIVRLRWKLPDTDTNIGWAADSVFYIDTAGAKRDSAHNAHVAGINDTVKGYRHADISVTPSNLESGASPEHPYRYWVLAGRKDGILFHTDSATITWAGAERLGGVALDTSKDTTHRTTNSIQFKTSLAIDHDQSGYRLVDSDRVNAQVLIAINNGVVTLTTNNAARFLDNRIDPALSLSDQYYKQPLADPSKFTTQSITLPSAAPAVGGVIVYLMMHDVLGTKINNTNEWARIFIQGQPDGTFINNNGAINVEMSFQPGLDRSGNSHLPYY